MPVREMVAEAIRIAIDARRGASSDGISHSVLRPELVARGSSGRVPTGRGYRHAGNTMRPQVAPTAGASVRLRPIDGDAMVVRDGFWGAERRSNIDASIPHGLAQLEASGALGNFRNAAAGSGAYRGGLDDAGVTFPFLDTDVYKWLEAVAWASRDADASLAAIAEPAIAAVMAAQRADGYLGTYVQLTGGTPYRDLQWGHELYNVGHLLQAAIAWSRTLGDDRLLRTATRAVDHVAGELGPGQRAGIDGHPEIEMALVELYRETGEERHLALARHLVDQRGHGLLGPGRFGRAYWQDHFPVRDAPTVAGHAVRQMYLDCGAVDVAVETTDEGLLAAVVRRWTDMTATRTYLTGSLGHDTRARRSATPMSCRPTGRMPRRAPPSAASCSPGACSSPRARCGSRTPWSERS